MKSCTITTLAVVADVTRDAKRLLDESLSITE
jgi:hypothetical protein